MLDMSHKQGNWQDVDVLLGITTDTPREVREYR